MSGLETEAWQGGGWEQDENVMKLTLVRARDREKCDHIYVMSFGDQNVHFWEPHPPFVFESEMIK